MARPNSRVPCEVCGKSLTNTRGNIGQHMRKLHGQFKRGSRAVALRTPRQSGPQLELTNALVIRVDGKAGVWLPLDEVK